MTEKGRTVFRIPRNKINCNLDLHLLGKTIELILEAGISGDPSKFDEWSNRPKTELRKIKFIADRLDLDNDKLSVFNNTYNFVETLKRLNNESNPVRKTFFGGFVRIPNNNIKSYGNKIRKLTDIDKYQRLRGIKQLGLAYLVYPGAIHTRFEHSLGVFENTLKFIDSLCGMQGDFRFVSCAVEEELIATAICSLFHDIGHYPFAHQFRVKDKFPRHELRTLELMKSDDIRTVVCSTFNNDVYECMIKIFEYIILEEEPDFKADYSDFPNHYNIYRSIISGPIDADKLDYIRRDSVHAGVPYGLNVDNIRFFQSLRIYWDKEGRATLLLSDKGRVCAEAMAFARYLMMSEVYWQHTIRSFSAMLSEAVSQLEEDGTNISDHTWDSDNMFMTWLESKQRSKWFVEMIKKHSPI